MQRYSRNIHGLNIAKKIFRFDYFSKALSLLREEDYSVLLDERGYEFRNGWRVQEKFRRVFEAGRGC